MKYQVIDKEQIEIRTIENLEEISISNILNPSRKTLNTTLLGIFVNANRKFYHYIQTDRYFEEYLNHIIKQYQREKELHPIKVSKELIPILEQEISMEEEKEISNYLSLVGCKEQKIKYPKTKVDQIRNILFQELQNIAKIVNHEETFQEIIGYRDLYHLRGIKNNKEVYYPIRIEKEDDFTYHILVENFFKAGNGLKLDIWFQGKKTILNWENEISTLSGYHDIEFSNKRGQELAAMYEKGTCIYIDRQELQGVSEEEQSLIQNYLKLFHIEGDFQITKLPWGDYHLEEVIKEEPQEGQEKKSLRNLDLTITNQNVYLTYHSQVRVKSHITNYELAVEGRKSFHHAYLSDPKNHYGVIESRFYQVPFAKSAYKLHLEDNYFYESFETKNDTLIELEEPQVTSLPVTENEKGYQLIKKKEKRGEE